LSPERLHCQRSSKGRRDRKTLLSIAILLIPCFAHAQSDFKTTTDCDKVYPKSKFAAAHQMCLENNEKAAQRKIESDKAAAELQAKCDALPAQERAIVARKELQLGMSEQALRCSKGEPQTIHQSVGSWGVRKQFVYVGRYVYVENGKVTSWSE